MNNKMIWLWLEEISLAIKVVVETVMRSVLSALAYGMVLFAVQTDKSSVMAIVCILWATRPLIDFLGTKIGIIARQINEKIQLRKLLGKRK